MHPEAGPFNDLHDRVLTFQHQLWRSMVKDAPLTMAGEDACIVLYHNMEQSLAGLDDFSYRQRIEV